MGRIEQMIASDESLARAADILRSVPGIGPVASTMLIAKMQELGQIIEGRATALTGLTPIAHDSGAIGGGRRHAMACDVPGCSRSEPSQSNPENIRWPAT
jgi:transposase